MSKPMLGPLMLDLAGTALRPDEARQLHHPSVGGVILFTRNFSSILQLEGLIGQIRQEREDLLIAADTEGGRVQRFREGFVRLPALRQYGEIYRSDRELGLELARAGGWVLAAELRAVGVDLAFAPVVDVDDGISRVIGDRSFAGDAATVLALSRAHIAGLRQAGMAATAKHFPGHGRVVPDSHLELPEDPRAWADIAVDDLQPYQGLIDDGLESVMVAHVRYPAVDALPASISEHWIGRRLRAELGFAGAVFSDDLSMGGLTQYGDVHQRFAAALQAGCDMIPVCNRPQEVAALLERDEIAPQAASRRRLAALRGRGGVANLNGLRKTAEYMRNISLLNQQFDTGL